MTIEPQNAEAQDETSQLGLLEQIVIDLDAGNHKTITSTLKDTHPSIVANLTESLPQEHRSDLWQAIPEGMDAGGLTTVTDIIGFLSFLGLASIFLL